MVDALLVHSNSSNCQEDVDKFLFSLGKMTGGTADPPPTTTDDDVVSSHLELPATVRSVLSRVNRDDTITSQESNILAYISGYIVRKIKPSTCCDCVGKLVGPLSTDNSDHSLLLNKTYPEAKVGLVVPSAVFLDVVKELEAEYCETVESVCHLDKVRLRIVTKLSKLPCLVALSCPNSDKKCNVQNLVVNLFVTMRLHHTLKLNSKGFGKNNTRRNKKTMKFSHV